MEMAYSKAWRIIRTAEAVFGCKLLSSTIGGAHGGGAVLTPEAERLLAAYEAYCADVGAYAQEKFEEAFGVLPDPAARLRIKTADRCAVRRFSELHFLGRVGSSSVGLGMGCSLWATMVWISSTVRPRPR